MLCIGSMGGLIFAELLSRSYLEVKAFQTIIQSWKEQPHIVQCYQISEQLEYEANWGNCRYPVLSQYKTNDKTNILGTSSEDMGIYRIVVLGDSVMHGGKLTKILEDTLNSLDHKPSLRFEVINMSTAGYNTSQEVKLLRLRALDLHPQMVILQFTLNDFEFSPIVFRQGNKLAWFFMNGEKSYETNETLFRISSLYRFIKFKMLTTSPIPYETQWMKKKEVVSRALDEYKTLLTNNHISNFVIIFPYFKSQQPEPNYSLVLSLLQKKRIDFIDLLPYYTQKGSLSSFASVENGQIDDIHPDYEKSDPLIARILLDYITAKMQAE